MSNSDDITKRSARLRSSGENRELAKIAALVPPLLTVVVHLPDSRAVVSQCKTIFSGNYEKQIKFLDEALEDPKYKRPENSYEFDAIRRSRLIAHALHTLDGFITSGVLNVAIGPEVNPIATIAEVVNYVASLAASAKKRNPELHYKIGKEQKYEAYAPAAGSPPV